MRVEDFCEGNGRSSPDLQPNFRNFSAPQSFTQDEIHAMELRRDHRSGGWHERGSHSYFRSTEPHYVRSLTIARASASDIKRETADFEKAINATTNLLVRVVMPNVGKARAKELEFESRLNRLPNAAP